MEQLKRKYGLLEGISMVVGIVIGSGIFFKSGKVLTNTGGNLLLALLAWFIGGLVMVLSAYPFSLMATRENLDGGVSDYIEKSSNKQIGYVAGWYFATIYFPIITSILGYLSMNYIFLLFQGDTSSWYFWLCTVILVIGSFIFNFFAPKVSGKFQVSTTIIKLIPIVTISIVGTIYGSINGNLGLAFKGLNSSIEGLAKNNFAGALLATVFSYEGWVIATSINGELKEAKKNLPKSLIIGTFIVMLAYIAYNLGLSSIIPDLSELINLGSGAPYEAMGKLLGKFGEVLFSIIIIISCLGTLNGLTIGCSRAMFHLAGKGQGIKPNLTVKLHKKFNTSLISFISGLVLTLVFLLLWFLSFKGYVPFASMDELCIAMVYSFYIIIYVYIMKNYKDLHWVKRFLMPMLAIFCSIFVVFAASGMFSLIFLKDNQMFFDFCYFLIIVTISTVLGIMFYFINKKNSLVETAQIKN